MGGSDLSAPNTITSQDLSVQKKNTLNANNDNTSTSNNQDFLDLLGLDMSATQSSTTTTNLTSNVVNSSNTNMNNVLMGAGTGGGGGGLLDIISTASTAPTNGNDLSSIMAAASINMPSMDITAANSLINDPLVTTAALNNVSVVSICQYKKLVYNRKL